MDARVGEAMVAVMDCADQDAIRRTLAGDGEAFRAVVERHQDDIARKLRRFAREPRVLEELVQDVFVEAYFSLRRYRGDAPLAHWLHRIAVRVGYRYWKMRQREPAAGNLAAQEPAAATPAADGTEELAGVLAQLSPRDRLVVTLLYLEEHSVAETAALTGWSQTMVKVQAFRARARLRKLMSAREQRAARGKAPAAGKDRHE
jgi:RNA polymerase sigma-70 factor (ECF subfamily)